MALEANNICFRYGPRFAIEGASLHAPSGQLTSIIGANGSGKTTLMKLLGGLLPVESGTVLLDERPLDAYPPSVRARHLTYVPQSHDPAFEFTVEQMVLMGRIPWRGRFGGFENEDDLRSADEALQLLELQTLRNEPVTHLSGGELQRVMLARAIAQNTNTLLLDEPTSHLDVAHQESVLRTIRRRIESHGLAVVASIHDLNLASIYSDTIIAIADGRIIMQGTPQQVLNTDVLEQLFGTRLHVEPNVYGQSPAIRPVHTSQEVNADDR
jgi:iron complex transport system ATP-binding protein